ncbi:MAG: bifunctional methylenetetrahydrofolate dehydrogenase/methenyltetrahydrofolate cyclohydrolase FolD [Deltaproteobacteria bacterium CG11_big_fil_rev_8_21_14_0_20_45_16]|nr:MAG: bifunctional methylenetetrahydrofolate dehydrogenase/methenyltetrahydrofolate cyclohydrolase FolD [Deltaproteobacteria bacterium CG11_big_fil_rev_8_21_14_0_20_45_16]
MRLLDGKRLSKQLLLTLKDEISKTYASSLKRPGLCVLRIGEDPASKIYVNKKIQTCNELGIQSSELHLDAGITQSELLKQIICLNQDPAIHGILIQLPLPKHLNSSSPLEAVSPLKDVDGFHPTNLGRLMIGEAELIPCTPLGIMSLLDENSIEIKGKRAVVIGRSRIVGRPISLLLDQAGATVTVVHLQTSHPEALCKEADILVAAAGKPNLVGKNHIKEGVVIVDVGIHRTDSGKLIGDVNFEEVKELASAITPVPGGVGPMTVCSLMQNTWKAFCRLENIRADDS